MGCASDPFPEGMNLMIAGELKEFSKRAQNLVKNASSEDISELSTTVIISSLV